MAPLSSAAMQDAIFAWRYRARRLAAVAAGRGLVGFLHAGLLPSPWPRSPTLRRAFFRRYHRLLADELADVRLGVIPPDLLRWPISTYARRLPALARELPRVVRRGRAGAFDDLPPDVVLERYPPYYRRTFHWQTDGWLSKRSAALYDVGVELLFGGTADVMRRRVLRPLVEALASSDARSPRPEILDVACGTGRLLTQMAAVLPHAHLVGVDLSRPYAEHARARVEGLDVDVLVENVERLPFRDGHFDAATCVFLFHELPRDVRRRVAAEVLRVLKPGAPFIVIDSAQRHDGQDIAPALEIFPAAYHEPYFRSFLEDPIAALLTEVGFLVNSTAPAFVATRTVARRAAS